MDTDIDQRINEFLFSLSFGAVVTIVALAFGAWVLVSVLF